MAHERGLSFSGIATGTTCREALMGARPGHMISETYFDDLTSEKWSGVSGRGGGVLGANQAVPLPL